MSSEQSIKHNHTILYYIGSKILELFYNSFENRKLKTKVILAQIKTKLIQKAHTTQIAPISFGKNTRIELKNVNGIKQRKAAD